MNQREGNDHPIDPTTSQHAPGPSHKSARRVRLRLASAVMFVRELGRSAAFYSDLLAWDVALRDDTAALLVGLDGAQLYLRRMGPNALHPLGHVGIQYLIWTAEDAADLDRCERPLRDHSP